METPFKEGYLLFPPHGVLGHIKKSWHKRYCQLFKSSKHGIERLEVFDNEEDLWKTSTVRIITLENCIKITQDIHKHPNVFTIITKTSIHHLATLTEKDLEDWIIAFQSIAFKDNLSKQTIEEDNDLYCSSVDGVFTVKLVSSEASTRCNLEPATYVLVIASASLHLHDSKDHRLLFTWPFRYIRRYGYREGKFTFEAGRKCETGEGTFHFEHSNQQDIFRCMSTKMKHMRKLLTGESTSTPVIICGDNQFQAALSMEARSRSPLPPSPTSATPYGDLANISGSQSTTKFSTVDSVTLSNPPPVPKPKPIKPPRKSLHNTNVEKTEDVNAENCSIGKFRVFPPSESSVPLLLTTSSLTSFYVSSNNSPLIMGSDTVSDGYDKVEVRREAWRTLGIDDVNHTEKANPESDIEEDGLESILKHSGSRMPVTNDTFTTNQSSKILLPQMSCKSDASENYDTLQHFGSTSRLNNNPGYRHIPPIFPTTSGNTETVTQNLSQKNYDEVINSMQAFRLADDSHYGYGMIRKKSTPSESDVHENMRPNHEVHNELEYAIVQKSKRV